MLVIAETQDWVNTALAAGALLGGVGYALGQFLGSRRKGLSDSLKTALDEIEVERIAKERLARVATDRTDELSASRLEITTLRNALTSGGGAEAAEIIAAVSRSTADIKMALREEHEKLRQMIEKHDE